MIENEAAMVTELELAVLAPEVCNSAERLEVLLDPDFEDIGKSGRLWTRGELMAAAVADTEPAHHRINFSDMSGRQVARASCP